MHKHSIIHRDIKLENIVLSHVNIYSFREWLKSVISDGQSTVPRNLDLPCVELPSIYPLRS